MDQCRGPGGELQGELLVSSEGLGAAGGSCGGRLSEERAGAGRGRSPAPPGGGNSGTERDDSDLDDDVITLPTEAMRREARRHEVRHRILLILFESPETSLLISSC